MINNPQNLAFLFPGQGSQKVGMGAELAQAYPLARHTFEEADHLLGFSLSKLAWEGPEQQLNDTINTQPALLVHSISTFRVYDHLFPESYASILAGHSLGEISALVAAEVLTFENGLKLVRKRGELMKSAGETSPGGMAAIIGLDLETIEKICVQASSEEELVQIANDNCPGQVVISGAKSALERANQLCSESGAKRVIPLAVSIAAHSYLMEPAQVEFSQAVNDSHMNSPKTEIVGNVNGRPLISLDEIHEDLRAQLTSRVRWTETIHYMIDQGIDTFIEFGSGSVLCGLLRRINRSMTGIPIGNPKDFENPKL